MERDGLETTLATLNKGLECIDINSLEEQVALKKFRTKVLDLIK
jgi:hypothetical protein